MGGNMKKALIFIILLLFGVNSFAARTVFCVNCSNQFIQLLDRITNLEQLAVLNKQYGESVIQTKKQIKILQNNIKQYENMLQNTRKLKPNLLLELGETLLHLARRTAELQTMRGDIIGLGDIFVEMYKRRPESERLGRAKSPEEIAAANAAYKEYWDRWSDRVDIATRATFQLSGSQLAELQNDTEKLQEYINELISTPEGQMQTLQAGNPLATIQINEARQLRELVATRVQSDLASQQKAEKMEQVSAEKWRSFTDVKGMTVKEPTALP